MFYSLLAIFLVLWLLYRRAYRTAARKYDARINWFNALLVTSTVAVTATTALA